MQIFLGWLLILIPGSMFLIQLVSTINFSLAQKLGLQEKPGTADPLLLRAERYTAYWDLITLIWLPIGGVLMVMNHAWWPLINLIGATVYVDAAGREAAKNLSFRHEKIKTGTQQEQRLFFATYILMAMLGIFVIVFSLKSLIISL